MNGEHSEIKITFITMTILYIGNSTVIFEQNALEKDISFFVAKNSFEGVRQLKNNKQIDVIICDFNLPDNTGLFLYDVLQCDPSLKNIPFILVSEKYSQKIFAAAFKKGLSDYFVSSSCEFSQIIDRSRSIYRTKNLNKNRIECTLRANTLNLPISKRIFDIIFATAVLVCIAPIILIVMLVIRLESKGKVYYIDKKVGRNTFSAYKLRSMRSSSDILIKKLAIENNQYKKEKEVTTINLDEPCPKCAELSNINSCSPILHLENKNICDYWYNHQKAQIEKSKFINIVSNTGITRIGKFIRNTGIDNLPQLINVIKGDMSIVGNRPLSVCEAELLTKDHLSKRFLAPAGITGLWQVELRGKGGGMSEEERIHLDNDYADKFTNNIYSFWYDMKLILRNILGLFQKSTI